MKLDGGKINSQMGTIKYTRKSYYMLSVSIYTCAFLWDQAAVINNVRTVFISGK